MERRARPRLRGRGPLLARRAPGAALNSRPIRVSPTAPLQRALLVTGFPYSINEQRFTNLDHFHDFSLHCQAVRRDGSAALDLCYVACGRFDGFWELKLSAWDTAAGTLVAAEAGAAVTNFDGGAFDVNRPECLVSNGLIHAEMLAVLALRRGGETKR